MTTDPGARIAYSIAKARHARSKRRRRGSPVVVFSMAKTGSSAVVAGLRAAGFDDVHHVHDLDPTFLAREEAQYHWRGRPWRNWDAQQLLRRPPSPAAPWRVVSIVRDPIAQKVSAFFQPGARLGYLRPEATVDALLEPFGDRLDHLNLRWFETHLEPTLGIDVYASPFDPARGYAIVDAPAVRLLLLRCEGLEVAPTALGELLGQAAPVEIQRTNVGADKQYADLYASFARALEPTPEQIEAAYSSRLVRHFYAGAEIDRFRSLWDVRRRADTPHAGNEQQPGQ